MTLPVRMPKLPDIPEEYSREVFARLVKALEAYHRELNATGALRATTINLSNLPTSAVGLATGDLWNDAGTVKIV